MSERKILILIIEDNFDLAKVLSRRLQFEGYTAQMAADATQGVAIARKEKPDLIILDWMLPGGGGLAVLKRLRQMPETTNIPVIVLTGMRDPESKEKALAAGVSEYLEKPYDPGVLLKCIEKAIPEPDKESAGKKILIIEDDEEFATVLAKRLQLNNYETIIALDTLQGISMALREKPNLILLDLLLPAGGGFLILERLKYSPDTLSIPVIVLSGIKDPERVLEAFEAGALDYIEKPYDPETLLKSIKKILESRS